MIRKLFLTLAGFLYCSTLIAKPEFGKSFGFWRLCFTDFAKSDTEICKNLENDKDQKISFDKVECSVDKGFSGTIDSGVERNQPFHLRSVDCSLKGNDIIGSISTECLYGKEISTKFIIGKKSKQELYSLILHCKSYKY
jgi:hypothetical protein